MKGRGDRDHQHQTFDFKQNNQSGAFSPPTNQTSNNFNNMAQQKEKKQQSTAAQNINESSADRKRRNIAKIGLKTDNQQEANYSNSTAFKKQNYNSQPKPVRPTQDQIFQQNEFASPSQQQRRHKKMQQNQQQDYQEDKEDTQQQPFQLQHLSEADLMTSKLKQMSREQIVQKILKHPEIMEKFKESMMEDEKIIFDDAPQHPGAKIISLEDIMPISNDDESAVYGIMAHQIFPKDPLISHEYEVPQEKTLNTEDFNFTGLPSNQGKPRLYKQVFQQQEQNQIENHLGGGGFQQLQQYSDSVEESIEAAGREIFKLAQAHEPQVNQNQKPENPAAPQCYSLSSDADENSSHQVQVNNFENLRHPETSSSEPSEDVDSRYFVDEQGQLVEIDIEGGETTASLSQKRYIGIHRMQDINSLEESNDADGTKKQLQLLEFPFQVNQADLEYIYGTGVDDEEQEQYFCPVTGAHFNKADLFQRIKRLQKRRALIDLAIAEEYRVEEEQRIVAEKKAAAVQKQQLHQKETNSSLSNKQQSVNQQRLKQYDGPPQAKHGRNKSNQLAASMGGDRQNLTDGNQRVVKGTKQQNKTVDSQQRHQANNKIVQPRQQMLKDDQNSIEDEQAMVLNAGKHQKKYRSNCEVVVVKPPQPNNASSQHSDGVVNTAIQNNYNLQVVSAKQFQQQQSQQLYSTNQNVQRKSSNHQQPRKNAQMQSQAPPHEQLAQYAATAISSENPLQQQSQQQQNNAKIVHHELKTSSLSAARSQVRQKRSRDSSNIGGVNKNQNQNLNVRQQLVAAKQQKDDQQLDITCDMANSLSFDQRKQHHANQQHSSSNTTQQQNNQNNNNSSEKRNSRTTVNNFSNNLQQQRPSAVYQNTKTSSYCGGAKTATQHQTQISAEKRSQQGKTKGESVSFDHRKQLSNEPAATSIDPSSGDSQHHHQAYRSVQDARNNIMHQQPNAQKPANNQQHQYWSHGSRGSSKYKQHQHQLAQNHQLLQGQNPPQPNLGLNSQLIGVKSHQIQPPVSQIIIQKERLRIKQKVQQAIISTNVKDVAQNQINNEAPVGDNISAFNLGQQQQQQDTQKNRRASNQQAQSFDSAISGSRNLINSVTVGSNNNNQQQQQSARFHHQKQATQQQQQQQKSNSISATRTTQQTKNINREGGAGGGVNLVVPPTTTSGGGGDQNITINKEQQQFKGVDSSHASYMKQKKEVEQFIGMLSGTPVVITKPSYSSQTTRGTAAGNHNHNLNTGGNKQGNTTVAVMSNKQGGGTSTGAHARTNTFDNRSTAKVSTAVQQMVLNQSQANQNSLKTTGATHRNAGPSLTQKLLSQTSNNAANNANNSNNKAYQSQQQSATVVYSHNHHHQGGKKGNNNKSTTTATSSHVRHLSGDDMLFKSKWDTNNVNYQGAATLVVPVVPGSGGGDGTHQRAKSKTAGSNQPLIHQRPTTAVIKHQTNVTQHHHSSGHTNKTARHKSSIQQGRNPAQQSAQLPSNKTAATKIIKQHQHQHQQVVAKGSITAVQGEIQSPQASSQRAFIPPNKNITSQNLRQSAANSNNQQPQQQQQIQQQIAYYLLTDHHNATKGTQQQQQQDQISKSYNSVPLKTKQNQQTQNQQIQYQAVMLSVNPAAAKMLYRLQTDRRSESQLDDSPHDELFQLDGNQNDHHVLMSSPKQHKNYNPVAAAGAVQPQQKTTKHRKSNSLGYKVVIGGSGGGHNQNISSEQDHSDAALALFKTFNTNSGGGGGGGVGNDKKQQRGGAAHNTTAGQNQTMSKQIIQQSQQHRRNASMYQHQQQHYPTSIMPSDHHQIVAGTTPNQQQSMTTTGNKHKKSHSVSNHTSRQQPNSQQKIHHHHLHHQQQQY